MCVCVCVSVRAVCERTCCVWGVCVGAVYVRCVCV